VDTKYLQLILKHINLVGNVTSPAKGKHFLVVQEVEINLIFSGTGRTLFR
jgi:hypothetical protein